MRAFAEWSPCIYQGKIVCSDCDKQAECDMIEGRRLRELAYIAGAMSKDAEIEKLKRQLCEYADGAEMLPDPDDAAQRRGGE